jgi:zinc protease
VLLREVRVAPVVELQIWAKVGSADERPGEEGLAHFHEHMLFKGTARRGVGQIAGEIEGVGGRINAYTTFDVTVYHATVPSEHAHVALDVLADAVGQPAFDPAEVAREVEVVLEEIRRSEDSPHHVLSDALFSEAYQTHPYRAPILGTPASVAAFDQGRVQAFYRRWYTPENLVVVAVGDFDSAAFLESVRATFASWTPGGTRRNRPHEPTQRQPRCALLRRPFETACLELAWPIVEFRHIDAPLLDLLGFILGEGDSSRLVRRVKEHDALADRIDSSSYTPLDAGLFGASADAEPEQVARVVEAVAREVELLRLAPVTEAELEKARTNFLATEHWERESVSGLARKLGSFHVIAGAWQHEAAYLGAIRRATPADLLRVAREWLAPERLTVAAVLPEDADGLAVDAVLAAAESGARQARGRFARPVAREREVDVHSYELGNGIAVHVVPRHELPVVSLRAALLGGLLHESPATAGVSNFLASMWLRGTLSRSAADFAREVESLAADVDGFSGRNSAGLTLEVTRDQLSPALDLFCEALLEPAFAAEELERERRETLAALARREDRLGSRVFDLFTAALWKAHPYGLPISGTPEAVQGFTREMLIERHARTVRPDNLVVAVVGDVAPDDAAAELSRRLGELRSGAPAFELPGEEPPPDAPREVELRKDRAQRHLVIGFRGLGLQDPDREALEVLTQMLSGQGGRLFLELRDRKSLAYTVTAMNVEGVAPGFFAVYIATAPEKLEEAQRSLHDELTRVLEAPPGEAELAASANHLVGNFVIDEQRSATRAAHIALDARYGLGPAADRDYAERVRAVTREDVLRVARRVIRLDAPTVALIR